MESADDNDRKSIILDFATITNPTYLIEALIVFQRTHERICVNSELMQVDFDWPNNTIGEIAYDLRDPGAITFLGGDFDLRDISFQGKNLPLALKLFQYAINKGYIEVVEPADEQWYDRAARLLQALDFQSTWSYVYEGKDRGYFFRADVRSGWPFERNLSLAMQHSMQLAVSDIRPKQSADYETHMFVKIEEQTIRQVIQSWQPTSFEEILAAIDHPSLLPSLTDAVKDVVNNQSYKDDVNFFFPRWLLDTVTFGQASNIEMLYKIYRHNRNFKKEE
jgi:hypothetical protein